MSPTEQTLRAHFPNMSEDVMSATLAIPRPAAPPSPMNRADIRSEARDLHRPFLQWCESHAIECIHAHAHKASTIEPGMPDCVCARGGKVCYVEFKRPGQKLTPVQVDVHARLKSRGLAVITATSFEEARVFVMGELGI